MRCCLEIAGKFSLLTALFLTVVLLAVGIGAVTEGDANETAELSPPPPAALPDLPGASVVPVGVQARGGTATPHTPG